MVGRITKAVGGIVAASAVIFGGTSYLKTQQSSAKEHVDIVQPSGAKWHDNWDRWVSHFDFPHNLCTDSRWILENWNQEICIIEFSGPTWIPVLEKSVSRLHIPSAYE